MGERLAIGGKVLRILCALVLLSLGLAPHAPPVAANPLAWTDEAFLLPDGSMPTLCIGMDDQDPHQKPVRCEVCLLSATALLPAPDVASWLSIHLAYLTNPLRQEAAVAGTLSIPSPRSRAPPASA
jgi:hypothetical protein